MYINRREYVFFLFVLWERVGRNLERKIRKFMF